MADFSQSQLANFYTHPRGKIEDVQYRCDRQKTCQLLHLRYSTVNRARQFY
jgi:hypothetical protein